MCLLPVGVHILPVRYELVEIEVIIVWFGLIEICGVIPRGGENGICLTGLGCRLLVALWVCKLSSVDL